MSVFTTRSVFDVPAEELFAWHARPGAFERLMPPWERMRVVDRHGGITDGSRVTLEVRRGPIRVRWVAVHRGYEPGRQFQDVQAQGPFSRWVHTHRVVPEADGRSVLEDHVDYRLPFGPLGAVADRVARRQMGRLFAYRHHRIRTDLARHASVGRGLRLRVALTGASPLTAHIGAFLSTGGHLVQLCDSVDADAAPWDVAALEHADAVVHSGITSLPSLTAALDRVRSRARTLVILPAPGDDRTPAGGPPEMNGGKRRLVGLHVPLVVGSGGLLEGVEPLLAASRHGVGWVGLDDFVGAVHFALCRDDLRGAFDLALGTLNFAALANRDRRLARRLAGLSLPGTAAGVRLGDQGFSPLHPSLGETIRAELGASGGHD